MHVCSARLRRTKNAGFTLVELMTVVAITGILAVIGIALVRGHLDVAKANRALSGIQALRGAEESFRSQNGQYLNCSIAGSADQWYPMLDPGKIKYEWHQTSHVDWPQWRNLGLPTDGGTQFGFLVSAGSPATAYPALQTAEKPVLSASPDPWYLIQVKGNLDGDNVPMLGFATSWTGEVYVEHEGE